MEPDGKLSGCVFKFMGVSSCPGCGIGHSIYYFLHFDIARSIEAHVLGIPSTLAIIYQFIRPIFSNKNQIKSTWNRNNCM